MNSQSDLEVTDAILFFSNKGVIKEMMYTEFEAVLDAVVGIQEFKGHRVPAAFVTISPQLTVKAAVLFTIEFDADGMADPSWNIPVQHLAESAGPGPDLGGGLIRLCCKSQCSVQWHQSELWDPDMTPGKGHLVLIRDAVKRNNLALAYEEDAVEPPVLNQQFQNVDIVPEALEPTAKTDTLENDHRIKIARLIKAQRLRITTLNNQRQEELDNVYAKVRAQQETYNQEVDELTEILQQTDQRSEEFQKKIEQQEQQAEEAREELENQLKKQSGNAEKAKLESLKKQYQTEIKTRIEELQSTSEEELEVKDVEIAYSKDREQQLREELAQLKQEKIRLVNEGSGNLLEKMDGQGVIFVAYHPGAGHLTIPLKTMGQYMDSPMAYVSEKCNVPESLYITWLKHYSDSRCEAVLPNGQRCGEKLARVDVPAQFVDGENNCCAIHQSAARQVSNILKLKK